MIPIILIDRARAGNRIDGRTAQELRSVCDDIGQDRSARCVIMTGAGRRYFCAGEDGSLSEGLASGDLPGPVELIAALEQPVVAALNGSALDMGLELALACDVRIASEAARFGFPQMVSGRLPCHGGTQRLPRLIGRGRALEMILTGRLVAAAEALEMGLVDEVVPANQVLKRAEELAGEIAHKAPVATRYAKEAVRNGLDVSLDQGLRLEGDLYLLLQTTSDRTEGVKSFREKRKPEFKGE